MTIVRVTCDWCGTIELAPPDITLNLTDDTMSYDCPLCESRFKRAATVRVKAILTALHCPVVDGLGPITEPEIVRFVEALDRDW